METNNKNMKHIKLYEDFVNEPVLNEGKNVDPAKIKADILWGMLTVNVPLPKPPVSRSIKVSVSDTIKHTASKTHEKVTEEG
jgi:hypothetical protein